MWVHSALADACRGWMWLVSCGAPYCRSVIGGARRTRRLSTQRQLIKKHILPGKAFSCKRADNQVPLTFAPLFAYNFILSLVYDHAAEAMSVPKFSEWRKLPLSLTELSINTTLQCGQSFRWRKIDDEWSVSGYPYCIASLLTLSKVLHTPRPASDPEAGSVSSTLSSLMARESH